MAAVAEDQEVEIPVVDPIVQEAQALARVLVQEAQALARVPVQEAQALARVNSQKLIEEYDERLHLPCQYPMHLNI